MNDRNNLTAETCELMNDKNNIAEICELKNSKSMLPAENQWGHKASELSWRVASINTVDIVFMKPHKFLIIPDTLQTDHKNNHKRFIIFF